MFKKTCILDFETTGLIPTKDEIIEVALKVNEKDIKYESLVKPDRVGKSKPGYNGAYIVPKITEITGITNQMIHSKGITQQQVAKDIYKFLIDNDIKYIMAHNGERFDFIFLKILFMKYNLDYSHLYFIDTIYLIKNILKKQNKKKDSYSQKNLCINYNIVQHNAHRAIGDVIDLEILINRIISDYSEFLNKYINYNSQLLYELSIGDKLSDIMLEYISKFITFIESDQINYLIIDINPYKRSLLYNWIECNYLEKIEHKTESNNLLFTK